MLAALLLAGYCSGSVLGQNLRRSANARSAKIAEIVHELEHAHHHAHPVTPGKACISLPEMSVMFDGDVDEQGLEDFLSSLPDEQLFGGPTAAIQLQGSRWTSTAGDPFVPEGEPFFLTYSFVSDGVTIPTTNNGDAAAACNLEATMNANFPGGFTAFQDVVRDAFDQWQSITNITYVEVPDDGAPFRTSNGLLPSATEVGRGDIRIAMRFIDGSAGQNILAVNYFPNAGGDMLLDSGNIATFADPSNDFRMLRNVLLHEHGHGLGLRHVMPVNETKLMEPFASTSFDGPQEDDFLAAASLYGDFVESNDSEAAATPIGDLQNVATIGIDGVVIERGGEEDWYKFNAVAGQRLFIDVNPLGSIYQHGAQPSDSNPNPPLETIDTLAAGNLRITLNRNGQFQAFADAGLAGDSERIIGFVAPATGVYHLKVDAAGVTDVPQQYEVIISRDEEDAEPEFDMFVQTGTPVALNNSQTVTYEATTVDTDRHMFYTIENNGNADLLLSGNPTIQIVGPAANDYTVNLEPTSTTIGEGESQVINIGFRPSAPGVRSAQVFIVNNDANEGAFAFTVSGLGVAPVTAPAGDAIIKVFQVTPAFQFGRVEVTEGGNSDFPDVELGDDLAVFYFIENHGDADLVFDAPPSIPVDLVANASGFSLLSTVSGFPIPAGDPEQHADFIRIEFEPIDANLRTARVFIHSNAANTVGPFDFTLRGRGIEPIVELDEDCNANDIEDADDLADGTSEDCNLNDVPDECETDTDLDGIIDECDTCPGANDLLDSDQDGTPDCLDNCPDLANSDQLDGDNDGLGDACEPVEPPIEDCNNNGVNDVDDLNDGTSDDCNLNLIPDECESDLDGDGVTDECDECPGLDDNFDSDGDTIGDCLDNCPDTPNTDQLDTDGDGEGNACEINVQPFDDCNSNGVDDLDDVADGTSEDCDTNDVPDECQVDSDGDGYIDECDRCPNADDAPDLDGDGVPNCLDNCPMLANADQLDSDGDGEGDACEIEDVDPIDDCNQNGVDDFEDLDNGTSDDCDGNDLPDECQTDTDGDGVIDPCDTCAGDDDKLDSDLDGLADCLDNCPNNANADQTDSDGDGVGDACQEPDRREPPPGDVFCGVGSVGMMPLMAAGLFGMGSTRRVRRKKTA